MSRTGSGTRRTAILGVLAGLASAGCFAHHAGTPLDVEPAPAPTGHQPELVVGVREPEIELDPPIVEGYRAEAWTTLGDLGRAISLIRSLRASRLYREVDFEGRLESPPDLVIEVHENPRIAGCDADAPMMLLYLGVIPMWYSCDTGHHFSRVDSETRRFDFPWHETQLFGWLVPFLNLLPGWTWRPPEPSQRDDAFRAFLLSHRSELLAGSGDAERPRGPTR